ncbi:hypothetical protein DICVIV_11136 [Dictyocaulus viviparus]|uniref:Uncharacterized protein n=1 Tax=Dictyocaulus viviparus TaxID=29172 RepID=A0A0D8XE12_DICVI|nr:hypothetical protein DICVIV_11136 [Dictyocaulus viviparus]
MSNIPDNENTNELKKSFFKKYFLEGQHLDDNVVQEIPHNANFIQCFMIKYRKYIAFVFPVLIMQALWWMAAIRYDWLSLYETRWQMPLIMALWWMAAIRYDWLSLYETRWQMPLIMVIGALVAGMTSEGGGAVAFPFMTLALQIDPTIARDFSLLMQSIG